MQETNQEVIQVSSTKYFIEDALFDKVLVIKEQIYQKTEVNVSPRKLVNMLLSEADFAALRDKLIAHYASM